MAAQTSSSDTAGSSNTADSAFNEATRMMQAIAATLRTSVNAAGDTLIDLAYPAISQSTELLGRTVAPIADIPFIRFATGIPGLSWLLAALGQVNEAAVQTAVIKLRQTYSLDTNEQLAQRVMVEATQRAAQVGLLTNLLPPLAIFLFAIDIGAIAALQAEMIYRIAAIYGFPPDDVTRRGEVLAIWGFSTGSSSALKSGLSLVEVLPAIGTAIGIASDAAILYGVGFLACRYYETKQARYPQSL
ncbi:MAG: EcsC family protein [Leptolyngbyaceae cyanobacterium]